MNKHSINIYQISVLKYYFSHPTTPTFPQKKFGRQKSPGPQSTIPTPPVLSPSCFHWPPGWMFFPICGRSWVNSLHHSAVYLLYPAPFVYIFLRPCNFVDYKSLVTNTRSGANGSLNYLQLLT